MAAFYLSSTGPTVLWCIQEGFVCNGPLTRYAKLWVAHAPGMPGTFSPPPTSKETDPGMHNGTCVTHVPWCMPGSLNRGDGESVPGIPSACATCNFKYLARGPLGTAIQGDCQWSMQEYCNLLIHQCRWWSPKDIYASYNPTVGTN